MRILCVVNSRGSLAKSDPFGCITVTPNPYHTAAAYDKVVLSSRLNIITGKASLFSLMQSDQIIAAPNVPMRSSKQPTCNVPKEHWGSNVPLGRAFYCLPKSLTPLRGLRYSTAVSLYTAHSSPQSQP